MEMDQGKLFIGGISWDTNEERIKEYFGKYGEVMDAVIMRDRITGRARGFGFLVFSDPVVAEKVVNEKHTIDGRTVEAKKAVPRDDENLISRSSVSSTQGSSPGPARTKKIFVGGLSSTVTERDFKTYFDQFGTITDVVVMYDHNTQRPRGFGFITYDSEDSVDRVLLKTFHELHGKMVEVKRAVPKEMSPGPSRSPLVGYNNGPGRTNNFLNNYAAQGYNIYNALASGRAGFLQQFGSPAYGMGLNVEQGLNAGFRAGSNFSGSLGYARVLDPYFGGNQSRYNSPIGEPFFNSTSRNVWGNGGLNTTLRNNSSSGSYIGSGIGGFGVFGNNGASWGASAISAAPGGNNANYGGVGNVGYRTGENNYAIGRNSATRVATTSSFSATIGDYEGSYGDFYRYGDSTWKMPSSELENSGSFGDGIGRTEGVSAKESDDYGMVYNVPTRHSNRGIAS